MSVVVRAPDGTIRLYCKGSDTKVLIKIRADTPAELLDNTNANLHYFAKQVGVRAGACSAAGDWEGRQPSRQAAIQAELLPAVLETNSIAGSQPDYYLSQSLSLHRAGPPPPPASLAQGLRTLVVGTKIIDDATYQSWDRRYQEAAASFSGRDEALDALGREIEDGLELIGVTAIEDKLQVWACRRCKRKTRGVASWDRLMACGAADFG